jgi:N-acetylneuraminic acid mutarotase
MKAKGKLPDKRSYHSSVIYDGKLFIYGGEDIKEGRYADLQSLNLDMFLNHEN